MSNSIKLTFAGDADSLAKAAKQSEKSLDGVGSAAAQSGKQLSDSAKSGADLGTKMGHLGSAVSGAGDALDAVGGSLTAINDLQQASANRAARLSRALLDVSQAQEDYNQALRDGAQATLDSGQAEIDLEQANLDAATALKDYNQAVKEHGVNSAEAKQAALDLKQAQQDVKQAQEDSAQATRDGSQATIDAKTAQQDLNDANKEAHPPELSKWAENLQLVTPLLSAVVGVVGLVTAAQWLWNTALFASPITWIVLAVIALVAIIVLIATQTTWFQDIWNAAWGGIKAAASAVWDYFTGLPDKLKNIFEKVTDFISAPFKAGFNLVSKAWNNTIGKLHWSVPNWVPGIGGNSISAPTLPTFHTGGIVSGAMGSETLAVLQAGERVTPAGGGGGHGELTVVVELVGDGVLKVVRTEVGKRGGSVQRALAGTRG